MKYFSLLIAAVAALSLASCGGDASSSSAADGNSQATSVDPNDPNQMPPQVTDEQVSNSIQIEETTPEVNEQKSPEGEQQNTNVEPNQPQQTDNPQATNIDPNA